MSSHQPVSSTSRMRGLSLFVALLATACGGSASVEDISDDVSSTVADEASAPETTSDNEEATATDDAVVSEIVEPDEEDSPIRNLGGGTVTVKGVEYTFSTEFCANDEDGIFNQGNGVLADGTPFTVGIFVQAFGEGTATSVDLDIGQESIYGAPGFDAPTYGFQSMFMDDPDVTVEGVRVYGSGPADNNNGAFEDETVDMTFDGECGDATEPGADADQAIAGSNYCEIAQIEVDRSDDFSSGRITTAEGLEEYLTGGLDLMARMDVPPEISTELVTIRGALESANDAARAKDYNFLSSVQDFITTIGSPESISAGLAIADYNERVCGIDGPTQ